MKKILFVLGLALVTPAGLYAQPSGSCQARVQVGAAVGLFTADLPVDPALAGVGRHGLATTTGSDLEGSVQAALPLGTDWLLTTDVGTARLDVALERDASGTYMHAKTGDEVTARRLNVGLLHYTLSRYGLCRYTSVRAGVYRFGYQGTALNAPGLAGTMGFEFAAGRSRALFVELEVSVMLTKARPPLTPSGVVGNLRPAFGIRRGF